MMIEPIRYKKQNIKKNVFQSFLNECGDYYKQKVDDEVSQIWSDGINDWTGRDVFNALEDKNIDELKSLYENYYVSGLSEGASCGKALEKEETRIRKSKRNIDRVEPLRLHYGLDVTNPKEVYDVMFDKYHIPQSINIGQTWGWEYGDNFVHFEMADYLYFLDIVLKILNEYDLHRTCFIGDGSGLLSSLLYNNYDIKSSIHIDLAHLLLRQYINNYEFKSKVSHLYAETFDVSYKHDTQIVINQDSFPEMTKHALEKYMDNLGVVNKVPFILSYNIENGITFNPHHTDYRGIIQSRGYESVWRFDSTVRPPYVFELFYKGEE